MRVHCLMAMLIATLMCGCASRGESTSKPPALASAPQPTTPARSQYNSMRSVDAASGGTAPAMDRSRKINEQDCTKDIDFSAGNLRCK